MRVRPHRAALRLTWRTFRRWWAVTTLTPALVALAFQWPFGAASAETLRAIGWTAAAGAAPLPFFFVYYLGRVRERHRSRVRQAGAVDRAVAPLRVRIAALEGPRDA